MRLDQKAILGHAERLASALGGGATRVERNTLLALVGDFMAERIPEPERLLKTLRLVRAGNGGHLKRGGSYAQQIMAATGEIERFLAAAGTALEPNDLKSVFGWTARLLLVRGGLPAAARQSGARAEGRPVPRHEPARPRPARPAAAPPRTFGGIKPQGLSALEKLKALIENRDPDKES
jgi:hypothetical protein